MSSEENAVPTLTFSSHGPFLANLHMAATTVRQPTVTELGGNQIEVVLADAEVGVRLIGDRTTIRQLLLETWQTLEGCG